MPTVWKRSTVVNVIGVTDSSQGVLKQDPWSELSKDPVETLTAQGTLLASLAFHCGLRSSGTHGGAPISQQVLDKFEEVGFPAKQKDIQW